MKTKIKEMTLKRTINYKEVSASVAAYEDVIAVGGQDERTGDISYTFKKKEGISEIKNLDPNGIEPIKSDKTYIMVKPDLLDRWRIQYCDLSKELIQNPYKEFGNGVVVAYDVYTENLFDLDGNVYPKAMRFDSTGDITNRSYDLEKLYKYLKLYPERFADVEMRRVSYWMEDDESDDEEALTHEIRFVWTPTADEYAEFFRKQQEHYDVFKRNALEIAGVTDFAKSVANKEKE